jgi:hypothetical protein
LIYNYFVSGFGALIVLLAVYGWAQEPSVADPEDEDPPSGPSKELASVG